jgi:hypothetical protein
VRAALIRFEKPPMTAPALLIFVMQGCPACHDFMPRVSRAARSKGIGMKVIDVTRGQRGAALANSYKVSALPTTFARARTGKVSKKIGAISDADIERLLGRL